MCSLVANSMIQNCKDRRLMVEEHQTKRKHFKRQNNSIEFKIFNDESHFQVDNCNSMYCISQKGFIVAML